MLNFIVAWTAGNQERRPKAEEGEKEQAEEGQRHSKVQSWRWQKVNSFCILSWWPIKFEKKIQLKPINGIQ